ncbi:MAG: APC family permease [Nitrospiraceae bacterium]
MSHPQTPRQIGWFTAVCVLVSNIIGGGIFTTTGFLARDLGDPLIIMLLWLIGALVALAGAMAYAELGAALPQAGGDYVYLREAYGPVMSFLSGWTSFTIGFGAAIAASATSFAFYALRVLPLAEEGNVVAKALALLLLWSLTAVHATGVGAGSRLQRLLTTTKVLAIAGLILGGLIVGNGSWANLSARAASVQPSAGSTAVSFIFVMYCYLGWNVAGYIAGEIADPAKTLPRIMIGGTAFVAAVYLLLNLVYLYALPVTILGEPPQLPVAEKVAAALWGPTAARWLAGLLAVSIAGAVSAMVWAGPRVYWAMARDGVFASWVAPLHPRTHVPVRAILLQSAWASLLILTGTFEQLVVYTGVVLAIFTALTIGALFRLRRHAPHLTRPYLVPLYPWLPGLLIAGALGLALYSIIQRPVESSLGLATVLAGLLPYWWWKKHPEEGGR